MPVHPVELPEQRYRMKALHEACAQMTKVMARSRLNRTAVSRVPGATDNDIKTGYMVLVVRDNKGKWVGPYHVIDIDNERILLNYDERIVTLSVDRCKFYTIKYDLQLIFSNQYSITKAVIHDDVYRKTPNHNWNDNFWDVAAIENGPFKTFAVEIIE